MRRCLWLIALAAIVAGCGSAGGGAIDARNAAKLTVEAVAPPVVHPGAKLKVVRGADMYVLQLPAPNGEWLLRARAQKQVELFDAGGHTLLDSLSVVTSPTALAWSRDSTTFAVGDDDGRISAWDEFDHSTFDLTGIHSPVTALAFSPDKRLVVSAHADRTARVWDARKRKQVARIPLPDVPVTLRFSADGSRIVAESSSRAWTLRLPR